MTTPIEHDVAAELIGNEDITRSLDQRIESLREMVRKRPIGTCAEDLSKPEVVTWVRKFMFQLGRAWGHIEAARDSGDISHEHAEQLKNGAMALMQFHSGSVILGR